MIPLPLQRGNSVYILNAFPRSFSGNTLPQSFVTLRRFSRVGYGVKTSSEQKPKWPHADLYKRRRSGKKLCLGGCVFTPNILRDVNNLRERFTKKERYNYRKAISSLFTCYRHTSVQFYQINNDDDVVEEKRRVNPTQGIFRSLSVSEMPGVSRNSQSYDAEFALVDNPGRLKAQNWPSCFARLCCWFGFQGSEASIVKELYSGRKQRPQNFQHNKNGC